MPIDQELQRQWTARAREIAAKAMSNAGYERRPGVDSSRPDCVVGALVTNLPGWFARFAAEVATATIEQEKQSPDAKLGRAVRDLFTLLKVV